MQENEREQLRTAHRRLDQKIKQSMEGAWIDPLRLQELKKKKLALKDRLHQIETEATHQASGSVEAA